MPVAPRWFLLVYQQPAGRFYSSNLDPPTPHAPGRPTPALAGQGAGPLGRAGRRLTNAGLSLRHPAWVWSASTDGAGCTGSDGNVGLSERAPKQACLAAHRELQAREGGWQRRRAPPVRLPAYPGRRRSRGARPGGVGSTHAVPQGSHSLGNASDAAAAGRCGGHS